MTIPSHEFRCRATLAALTMALATAGCGSQGGGEARAEQSGASADTTGARVLNVQVEAVALSDFTDYVRIVGDVQALHDVTVSAEEAGTIASFAVEKGARVAQGTLIAKIDDAVLAAQVAEARATADLAREQFERQQRLWQEDRIGSELAYLQTRSAAEAASARLRTLEARLARTEIRAPVGGVFDEKFVEAGEMVSPGTPVVRVVTLTPVKIVGGVPERYALDVMRGGRALVTFDIFPGREFAGRIAFAGTTVDSDSRTIPVEILLDNPRGLIRPTMVANILVERAQLDNVVVVPQEVVQRTEDGYEVFVVVERDGLTVAEAHVVKLGPAFANRVVVDSGLAVGDRVITSGARMVDHGSLVRVVAGVEGR